MWALSKWQRCGVGDGDGDGDGDGGPCGHCQYGRSVGVRGRLGVDVSVYSPECPGGSVIVSGGDCGVEVDVGRKWTCGANVSA